MRIAAGRQQCARFGGQSRILDAFPVERVGEFHLGGFAEDCDSEGQQLLIDDHGQSVADTVWNLYRHALARQRLAPTLIEWDNNIPAFSTLARSGARASIDFGTNRRDPRNAGGLTFMLTLHADNGLALLQRAFAESVFFDSAPIPATIRHGSGPAYASRFSVYRNNVFASLIGAVAARYPTVRKLLWEETFNQTAHLYVTMEPPRSPVLLRYGESFPKFLRNIGQSPTANYVADVAELEAARTRAYHAADAPTLSRNAFGELSPDQIQNLCPVLHPSVQLLKSAFPIVSIWEANQQANDNTLKFWEAECALIARPRSQVEIWRLPPGAYVFLSVLMEGRTIAEAASRAVAEVPNVGLTECFAVLLSANVVVALHPPRGVHSSALSTT